MTNDITRNFYQMLYICKDAVACQRLFHRVVYHWKRVRRFIDERVDKSVTSCVQNGTASVSMQEKESIANSGGRETGKRVVSSTYVGKIR